MKQSALDVQTGGDHYKNLKYQPVQFCDDLYLKFNEGNVVKYTSRHGKKNGKEDLEKVLHYIDFIKEFEFDGKSEFVLFWKFILAGWRKLFWANNFYRFIKENNLNFEESMVIWLTVFAYREHHLEQAKLYVNYLIREKYERKNL